MFLDESHIIWEKENERKWEARSTTNDYFCKNWQAEHSASKNYKQNTKWQRRNSRNVVIKLCLAKLWGVAKHEFWQFPLGSSNLVIRFNHSMKITYIMFIVQKCCFCCSWIWNWSVALLAQCWLRSSMLILQLFILSHVSFTTLEVAYSRKLRKAWHTLL